MQIATLFKEVHETDRQIDRQIQIYTYRYVDILCLTMAVFKGFNLFYDLHVVGYLIVNITFLIHMQKGGVNVGRTAYKEFNSVID